MNDCNGCWLVCLGLLGVDPTYILKRQMQTRARPVYLLINIFTQTIQYFVWDIVQCVCSVVAGQVAQSVSAKSLDMERAVPPLFPCEAWQSRSCGIVAQDEPPLEASDALELCDPGWRRHA